VWEAETLTALGSSLALCQVVWKIKSRREQRLLYLLGSSKGEGKEIQYTTHGVDSFLKKQ